MFRETCTRRCGLARRLAFRRGQSIVVALLVLLLLGLAGALFVTIVARNLLNARHANRVVTADQYARAGITFAAAQLTNSMDGADWRPPLQFKLANPPTEPRELTRYTAASANLPSLTALPYSDDPDAKYLEAGFTRYNTGAGRFLLRLTYTPVLLRDTVNSPYYDPVTQKDASGAEIPVSVPPGKYIKIESIGREGVIDNLDPTTYGNNRSSDRLQSYQVAYQPIGITDYARFETNLANRSATADIGITSRFYADDADGGIATAGAYDFVTDPNNPNAPKLVDANGNPDPNGHPVYQLYPIFTTYGAADAYKVVNGSGFVVPNPTAGTLSAIDVTQTKFLPGGGSFHANMPVRFFGKNLFYLNNAGLDAPLYQDGLEVAGDLLLNGYTQGLPLFTTPANASGGGQRASVEINPADLTKLTAAPAPALPATPTMNLFVVPSNDTGVLPSPPMAGAGSNGGFNTFGGLVRDGSSQNDTSGQPRSIGRLEPPRMDAIESGSQLPRYKAIAMMSPPRLDPATGLGYVGTAGGPSPSQFGYGQSIYINNADDTQKNSTSIGGGSTLVDEWLNRTLAAQGSTKGGWVKGDFYDPPGVNITLGRQNVDPTKYKSVYGIRMALSPGGVFPNPDGTAGSLGSQTVMYDDINATNDPATDKTNYTGTNPDNDVLIYAEGNVRVHGIASADPADLDASLRDQGKYDKYPRHITIVTNGTAYIEGSLLKGNPDSTITVLAHDYVCVNTTQFLAGPQVEENSVGTPAPAGNSDANYHALTFGSDETALIQELTFGLPNGNTPGAAYNGSLGLYVSARPGGLYGTQAAFEIVNPTTGLNLAGNTPFTPTLAPLLNPTFGAPPSNAGQQYFNLNPTGGLTDMSMTPNTLFGNLVESDTRLLETRRDNAAKDDLELERVAVLPMDIRIEAVLYAQTGSFFVIPGPWFNSSPADTLDVFTPTVTATTLNGMRTFGSDPHFPFYGQPIDMKIIINGAVSEAQPVDVAVQTAWMLKWGWIPQFHGYASQNPTSNGAPLELAGHLLTDGSLTPKPGGRPGIGLQIIYNPQAGYPYHPSDGTVADTAHYLRSDAYGRPLPFSPKLPVSAALLFAGQSSEPPLLQ